MLTKIKQQVDSILTSGDMLQRRPILKSHNESNIPGVYIIGDLAGAPVIKLAMEQAFEVVNHISSLPDARSNDPSLSDLIVVGAGAAGLNAALIAQERGLRVVVLEKGKIANTIEEFPEGKWVYAEPDATPSKGKLWLDGARKEDLIARWHQTVRENGLKVMTEEGLKSVERLKNGFFRVVTDKAEYRARRVILATGQRGNPRKLGVKGEDRERVYHRLYAPRHYKDQERPGGRGWKQRGRGSTGTGRTESCAALLPWGRVFTAIQRQRAKTRPGRRPETHRSPAQLERHGVRGAHSPNRDRPRRAPKIRRRAL